MTEEFDSPEINFNPDLFNNVYWHIEEALSNDTIRFLFIYGGSSASKTFSVVQETIKWMLTGSDNNSLILRKYATDIKDSIYADFINIIKDWGLEEEFICQQNFIKCSSGSYIRFRGLDDSEKVKGISNFKRVILEEISQFEEVDFKQIKKRLRGKLGQKIIGIFNPISEDHWLKKNVFDKEVLVEVETNIQGKWINKPANGKEANTVVLKTCYLDNKYIVGPNFVDEHTIDDFEKDKIDDFDYYNIYGLGNWGRIRTGGEFWKDINSNIHFKELKWDKEAALHITWDDNVNPYITCLVWQIKKIEIGKETFQYARQIDEICLEDPRNRVKNACAEFKHRYPLSDVPKLFIYGDRTSIKESTLKEKGENFFTEIKGYLQEYQPTLRMQSVNPSVIISGKFVNECYSEKIPGIRIEIGLNCKKSIHDYRYALEDSDGSLKKTKKTNPVTKVQYEEFGHPSDAKRYFMVMAFASEYATHQRAGKSQRIVTGKNIHKNSY
ncbi:MAG: PBSX family phage terminase large subunit [Bacteroidota bacterium]